MSIILLILFLLCCINVKIAENGKFFEDYIEISRTTSVKGIFVILVFLRHYQQYIELNGNYDAFAKWFDGNLDQLLVTLFLFYSGYGVMEGIKKRGVAYKNSFPQKSIKLLLHFDIAVLLYLLLGLIEGNVYPIKNVLLSFVCWESIGNSNWYVLAVIFLYLFSFVAFSICKEKPMLSASILTVLCIGYAYVLAIWKGGYWYNTILCYPLGVFYSIGREKIEKFVMKNDIFYYLTMLIMAVCYYMCFTRRGIELYFYFGWTIFFTILVILVTMKIRFDNGFLQFLGSHVFSLYILQRLPMSFLKHYGHMGEHPYFYFILSMMGTIVLALLYDKAIGYMDTKIWRKRK